MINVCAILGGKNTGESDCEVRMKRPKYILPTKGKVFTAGDLASEASFKAALLAAMLLSRTDNSKVYIFPEMRVATDNTGDPQVQSLADGYEEVTSEPLPKYLLESTAGICQHQAMVSFNGWNDEIFVIDEDSVLWYVKTDDDGGAGFSVGALHTDKPRWGGSGAIVTSKTRITFGSLAEFASPLGVVKITFDPTKLANTVDVVLYEKAASTANVLKVAGKVSCTATDIYTAYSAGLANVARWTAKNATTGAAITITSVTVDAAINAWTITLDATAYNALNPGDKVVINLAAPTVLAAAGVKGVEGFELVHTVAE